MKLQNQNTTQDITFIRINTQVHEEKSPESPPNIIAKSLETFLRNIYCQANIAETKSIATNISFIVALMRKCKLVILLLPKLQKDDFSIS